MKLMSHRGVASLASECAIKVENTTQAQLCLLYVKGSK